MNYCWIYLCLIWIIADIEHQKKEEYVEYKSSPVIFQFFFEQILTIGYYVIDFFNATRGWGEIGPTSLTMHLYYWFLSSVDKYCLTATGSDFRLCLKTLTSIDRAIVYRYRSSTIPHLMYITRYLAVVLLVIAVANAQLIAELISFYSDAACTNQTGYFYSLNASIILYRYLH